MSDFDEASAPSAAAVSSEEEESEPAVEVMVVDNGALRHLEILENLSTETGERVSCVYVLFLCMVGVFRVVSVYVGPGSVYVGSGSVTGCSGVAFTMRTFLLFEN